MDLLHTGLDRLQSELPTLDLGEPLSHQGTNSRTYAGQWRDYPVVIKIDLRGPADTEALMLRRYTYTGLVNRLSCQPDREGVASI